MTQDTATLGLEDLHIGETTAITTSSNGTPDQAVGRPVTVDAATGEVLVRLATGKQRVRKGQPPSEYAAQLAQFFGEEGGPARTPVGWMGGSGAFDAALAGDLSAKHSRLVLMGFVHRAYYGRQWAECLEMCGRVRARYAAMESEGSKSRMKREFDELAYIEESCRARGQQ